MKRKIVQIDEEKCNGCGLCIPNCHEGALKIVGGKAKLVSDAYCDGLGNCLGHCPQDAITVVEKEVAAFDFAATNRHLKKIGKPVLRDNPIETRNMPNKEKGGAKMPHKNSIGSTMCGCPGTAIREFGVGASSTGETSMPGIDKGAEQTSQLTQWPVQLSLIPPNAGFLRGADLLISADCVSVANPNFHTLLLKGRKVVMGCPKLDDVSEYKEKIKTMIEINDFNSITVAVMEVPCCAALYSAVEEALDETGKRVTLKKVVVGVDGTANKDLRMHY
jgi:Pyruvate/2-oxoacid:ferredoxin oxidoreductase delta subunit